MTNDELNQYILHYLTEDKTQSAIMLTGDWGTGKSYYINNVLKPFLEKDENVKHQCIVVSLYGISETVEISKAIYFETRAKFLQTKTETGTAAKITARTIVKGVTSFFGVDLSASSDNMRELYESADLSGKLIVLEDLERSGLDILQVLGYVNSLVEQDGVKVLLVANEQEILKTEEKIEKGTDESENRITINTEATEQYLRTKEKTVSDTIRFNEDYISAIQQIISSFDNEVLSRFVSQESAKDITDIMHLCKSWNLRSFIFACQKTADIYNSLDPIFTSDDDFVQALFFGILFYVFRVKNGKELHWGKETLHSVELGCEKYPLFKFCYDYLTQQIIDTSNVQAAYDTYNELKLFDRSKSNSDPDIIIISSYYAHSEAEILDALNNIEEKLKLTLDGISFYMYGTIAVYAIMIKEILGCNIDGIKRLLVSNLTGKGNKLQIDSIFRTVMNDHASEAAKKEYAALQKEMAESLRGDKSLFPGFEYLPEQASDFYDAVRENQIRFHLRDGFACNLNMDKLAEMFFNGTAEQKDNIRAAFISVYRTISISEYLSLDLENIEALLKILQKQREGDVGDKINQLQYDWFIETLEEIVKKLSQFTHKT